MTDPLLSSACNIEIKASVSNRDTIRDRLSAIHPCFMGILHQIDVYFHTTVNRLKLRTIEGQGAQLISYQRANEQSLRRSIYHIVPCDHPDQLLAALRDAIGIRCRVEKFRELYLWHNVRIHLDRVITLGDFIELEAVLNSEEDVLHSEDRLKMILKTLDISPTDFLAGSYGDMIMNGNNQEIGCI